MKDFEIRITRHTGDWTTGTIGDCAFEVKHYSEPSRFGIETGEFAQPGRISKLWIARRATHGVVAAYDRGWDRLPHSQEEVEITQALIDRFN
ncbi:MAG: hypothetical protein IKP40_09945 [Clostridia bacterium]|nr:hypothetical protein [Clostridia bacterium]